MKHPEPTGVEVDFPPDVLLVSKTNPRGVITYASRAFIEISGYTEAALLGRPHAVIRHPKMPRCVFKQLWETVSGGREIFCYVINLCNNGDHYWVLAHITPDIDPDSGAIIGYHSSRRRASPQAIRAAGSLYERLLTEERLAGDGAEGIRASRRLLATYLRAQGLSYEQYIFGLYHGAHRRHRRAA